MSSGPLGKKLKKTIESGYRPGLISSSSAMRPEDVACKPRPSINALGLKRPLNKTLAPHAPGPSSSSGGLTLKKPRLDFGGSSAGPSGSKSAASTPGTPSEPMKPPLDEPLKAFCSSTEIAFDTFAEIINKAAEQEKFNKVARYIVAFLREVVDRRAASGRLALEAHAVATVSIIFKEYAARLTNANLIRSLLCVLCSSRGLSTEKQQLLLSWLTALTDFLPAVDTALFKAFLHDALGDRLWIDKPYSLRVSGRLMRHFGTVFPSRSMYQACNSDLPAPEYLPDESLPPLVFVESELNLTEFTLQYMRRWWDQSNDATPSRALIRAMSVFSALPEVRVQASRRIDNWLQNAKMQRVSLELLLFLGCNLGTAAVDRESLSSLLKLRSYKSKQVASTFSVMLRETLSRHPENLRTIIKLILDNEFSINRYPINMNMLQALFQVDSKETIKGLAAEMCSLMIRREEMAKPCRLFIRELVRSLLRTDFSFALFTEAYFDRIAEEAENTDDLEEHVSRCAVEMALLQPLIALTQPVRDAFAVRRSQGANAGSGEIALRFQTELREYLSAVVRGLTRAWPAFAPDTKEYANSFYRLLFIENAENYASLDLGPADSEWVVAHRIINECGLSESILIEIASVPELPGIDKLSLLEQLIKSAILYRPQSEANLPVIEFSSCDVADKLLEIAVQKLVTLETSPEEPPAPRFAVREQLWKAWVLLVHLMCGGTPPTLFSDLYNRFPTLRMLLKMVLTNNYNFPVSIEGITADEMLSAEKSARSTEETQLTEIEMKIPDTGLNERFTNIFCFAETTGIPRKPAGEQLTELRHFAASRSFSARLCEIRNPDLLAALIAEEGTAAAMPAIEELLGSNAKAVEFVPLECLCQFLLHHLGMDPSRRRVDEEKCAQISARLRAAFNEESAGGEGVEMALFLLERLSAGEAAEREAAAALLAQLFSPQEVTTGAPQLALSSLASFRHFSVIRTRACSLIARACTVESDGRRLAEYIYFLTETAEAPALHKIAHLLCQSLVRSDAAIQNAMIDFFARYVESADESGEAAMDEGEEAVEMITVEMGNKQVRVVSCCLERLLELLSRHSGGGPARQRLLSAILTPSGGLPSVKDQHGNPVVLLSERLRAVMLSSSDEQIVRLALETVDGLTSLSLICSFGLTTFSASQLLASLDRCTEEVKMLPDAKRAKTFVIAYRTRGAAGGEKFLDALSALTTSAAGEVKDESMEDQLFLSPLPFTLSTVVPSESLPPAPVVAEPAEPVPVLTKTELIKRLKAMVAAGQFKLCPDDFRAAAATEAATDACLEFLEAHLKFFLGSAAAFHEMVLLLNSTADKYPSIPGKLRLLCGKVLKSASVTPPIEALLRRFAGPSGGGGTAAGDAARKASDAVKKATPDDILETLTKRKTMNSTERARLLNRYLTLRPEVVDVSLKTTDVDRQIMKIFGTSAKNGVEGLVAQLWLRSRPETLQAVLQRLLLQYQPGIRAASVMEVLSYCEKTPYFYKSLSKAELDTAAAYMVERATESALEGGGGDETIRGLGNFVENMVDVLGFSVLEDLAGHCLLVIRSAAPRDRRVAAEKLLAELCKRFPCLRVSSASTRAVVEGVHYRLANADKIANLQVLTMFESDNDSDAANAVDSLGQMLISYPAILARQLPVIARLLVRIIESPTRTVRDSIRFRWVIDFVLRAAGELLDSLEEEQLPYFEDTIQGLTDFYEHHVAGTRDELTFSLRLLTLVNAYLKGRTPEARRYLSSDAAPSSIRDMARMHGEEFADVRDACAAD